MPAAMRPCAKYVDMTLHKTIGMFVVAAEHYHVRIIVQGAK